MLFFHPDIDLQPLTWLQPFLQEGLPHEQSSQPGGPGTLWLDRDGLALVSIGADLLRVPVREERGGLIRKAFGRGQAATVLDACAGFGFDTDWLLPSADVTYLEQDIRVVLMLRERLYRLGWSDPEVHHVRMQDYLGKTDRQWHTVYLDPMFTKRKKAALPKKALQVLAQLQNESPDVEVILSLAQQHASHRVVLKRRRKDPTVGRPTQQVKGSKVRFDIYLSS